MGFPVWFLQTKPLPLTHFPKMPLIGSNQQKQDEHQTPTNHWLQTTPQKNPTIPSIRDAIHQVPRELIR